MIYCVVCGKEIKPPDGGAICQADQPRTNPNVTHVQARYCNVCGREGVVLGTIYCERHQRRGRKQ